MSAAAATHAAPSAAGRRVAVIALVAVVLVGLGLLDHYRPPPAVATAAPAPFSGATAAPASSESSAWYCTGGGTGSSPAATSDVYLSNVTDHAVSGTMSSVTDTGATATTPVSVPARSQVAVTPGPLSSGSWVADTVALSGGGVSVTQAVQNSLGWAQAPCASGTAQQWYYPEGSTANGSDFFITLYNPTATPDVVDLNFTTAGGQTSPAAYQGLVVSPGQLQVVDVGTYVQAEGWVSTSVATRAGRIVAGQLQELTGNGINGLALRQGAPAARDRWDFPATTDIPGGGTTFLIYNPTSSTETVTVDTRLASVSPAPFVGTLPPGGTWPLTTSSENRIPLGVPFAATVTASGGPGVVVDRLVAAPAAAIQPQTGVVTGAPPGSAGTAGWRWVVPAPGTPPVPATAGAAPYDLSLSNPSGQTVRYTVSGLAPAGPVPVHSGSLAPGQFTVIAQSALTAAAADPLLVTASGPLAVLEDDVPAGTPGAVTMPGIPLG